MNKNKGKGKTPLPNHTVFLYNVNCQEKHKGDCMMESIIKEKNISFKELEQNIFKYICQCGCEMTRTILEDYDKDLEKARDKKSYRHKGSRTTSIKTVFGEVSYKRTVYKHVNEEGRNEWMYLLDEAMNMDKIGLISTNLAEKIVETVTKESYRGAADVVTQTTGQVISHGGAWNLVQKLGDKICAEEKALVDEMDAGVIVGEEVTPILFEEMDGVYIAMQGKSKPGKKRSREMKVSVAYKGWQYDGKANTKLVGKIMTAGMESANEFLAIREAMLQKKYNTDEIEIRILNGDGGSWIKDPYEPETIFQLDRFHIYQEIIRKISDKRAQKVIRELMDGDRIDECFEFIEAYATSIESPDTLDKGSKKAKELLAYLQNNREGLIPYQRRGINLPKEQSGIVYKNLGTQENHNCSVITQRMKHRRMSWSINGANNIAKLLVRKENKTLYDTIERYTDGIIVAASLNDVMEVLSAAKAPKYDGKGNKDGNIQRGHFVLRDAMMTSSRKALIKAFG